MATIEEIELSMNTKKGSVARIEVLIAGLKQQVDDALFGAMLPKEVRSRLDAIFTVALTKKVALANAITANPPSKSMDEKVAKEIWPAKTNIDKHHEDGRSLPDKQPLPDKAKQTNPGPDKANIKTNINK